MKAIGIKTHVSRRNAIWGWHFVRANMRLSHDARNVTVAPGYIYTYEGGPLQHCEDGPARGLFACPSAFAALSYANGPVICRTLSWGGVIWRRDKLVSRHREVVAMANVESEIRLFACWCVRQVWHLLTDERSRKAIDVAEAFARGAATHEELAVARDAAWDAVGVAVGVARGVARDTVGVTAKDPVGVAAGIAARAFRNTAEDVLRAEFERRMLAAVGMEP